MAALVASSTLFTEQTRPSRLLYDCLALQLSPAFSVSRPAITARFGQLAPRSRCLQLQFLHLLRQLLHYVGQLFHRTYRGDSSKFALWLQCRDASSVAEGGHVGFHRQRGCHRIIERIDSLLFHSEGYLGLTQLLEISFECQSLSCTVFVTRWGRHSW